MPTLPEYPDINDVTPGVNKGQKSSKIFLTKTFWPLGESLISSPFASLTGNRLMSLSRAYSFFSVSTVRRYFSRYPFHSGFPKPRSSFSTEGSI